MIRIVLADDHAIMRAGLKQMFAIMPDMEIIAEAMDGEGVVDTLRRNRCDIVVLDLNMPGISGPELIVRLKSHWPDLPVLVLSMHDSAQIASRALKAGADGYVTKDSEPEVLLNAIRKVAAGGRFISLKWPRSWLFRSPPTRPNCRTGCSPSANSTSFVAWSKAWA